MHYAAKSVKFQLCSECLSANITVKMIVHKYGSVVVSCTVEPVCGQLTSITSLQNTSFDKYSYKCEFLHILPTLNTSPPLTKPRYLLRKIWNCGHFQLAEKIICSFRACSHCQGF
jgi:hypothetical protein